MFTVHPVFFQIGFFIGDVIHRLQYTSSHYCSPSFFFVFFYNATQEQVNQVQLQLLAENITIRNPLIPPHPPNQTKQKQSKPNREQTEEAVYLPVTRKKVSWRRESRFRIIGYRLWPIYIKIMHKRIPDFLKVTCPISQGKSDFLKV